MKNLVLCADGTGNLGGSTPDSNVYKIYHAIETQDPDHPQITFYDNGVGTANNSYWRAFTGAFGFGFKRNVCDLYEFLARNYDPGDRVFLFGFSRGAAQVRALSGFIAASGLVDGRNLDNEVLHTRIQQAFQRYQSPTRNPSEKSLSHQEGSHGVIPITSIGVWDTVSALGFPQDWNVTGVGMWVLNALFKLLDVGSDLIFPHRFYNYELTSNVNFAYHALAIDDERKSFSPLIWKELGIEERTVDRTGKETGTAIEQTWFAGAHSNVGGGYGRAGLANVTLAWMMNRVSRHHLRFKEGIQKQVLQEANVHGRLHDSRAGMGVFYRYCPRDLHQLCKDKLRGNIMIHRSALERLYRRTGDYLPGNLPATFDVVGNQTKLPTPEATIEINSGHWEPLREATTHWEFSRKWLYGIFLEFALLVMGSAWWFWVHPPPTEIKKNSETLLPLLDQTLNHVADVLNYVLPVMFTGLITFVVIQKPLFLILGSVCLVTLWSLKRWFAKKHRLAKEQERKVILDACDPSIIHTAKP